MSLTTAERSKVAPTTAAAIVASYLTVAGALCVPVVPFDTGGYRNGTTIYPVWVWVLVLAGLLSGIGALLAGRTGRAVAAAVALVAAMPLVGTGIVAYKHWKPAFGMGGGYGGGYQSLETLKLMALVIAGAALVAGVAAVVLLVVVDALPGQVGAAIRGASVLAGLAVIVGLSLGIDAGGYGDGDLTSVGAAGLIYAGPWGAATIVSGWLDRPAAIAALAATCGCVLLAVIGPAMTDLLWPGPTALFAISALPPALVLLTRLRNGPRLTFG